MELIRIDEAARIANVNPLTIRRRISEGQLTPFRQATNRRVLLVSREELERLMQPQRVETTKAAAVAA